jgi:hypothetical protein
LHNSCGDKDRGTELYMYIQDVAEILKHFEILIAYNVTRGCNSTWDWYAAYTL